MKKIRLSCFFFYGERMHKLVRCMKLTFIIVLLGCLQVSAHVEGQKMFTLNMDHVRIDKVLRKIQKESDYRFFYNEKYLEHLNPVSVTVREATLNEVMEQLLSSGLSYRIIDKNLVVISPKGTLLAQQRKVQGMVTDENGTPLVGVTVKVKGSTEGTVTDSEGKFSLVVDDSAVLEVSYIGYETQEVVVGTQTSLSITLKTSASSLNEVVVVGYGKQKKVTVTGSVAAVKGSELQKSPTVNLSNSLAGRLPGVTAIQSSGEPGYDGSSIRIRGTNTLGNNGALIVIDGVPDPGGGLDRLNPADIESMSILKDASAAIYGARAANGVILITTKQGKAGKPKLTYNFNYGWSQPTRVPAMANSAEYAEMNNALTLYGASLPIDQWDAAWQALKETGSYTRTDNGVVIEAPYQPEEIQKYIDGSEPLRYPNTDWFEATFKNWSPQIRQSLQISGGSEKVKYFASLGYQNQDAYYKNSATGYKQYDMRVNLDAEINKYIHASLGLTARQEFRHFPTQSAGNIFRMLIRGKPTEVAVWPNGLPGPDIEYGQNPVAITTNVTGYDHDKRNYFQTNGKVEFLIPGVKGLKLTGTASLDKEIKRVKTWSTPWYLYYWDGTSFKEDGKTPVLEKRLRSTYTDPRLSQSDENILKVLLSGFVNYDHTFTGGHTLNLMAAVTKETDKEDWFSAYRRYFISSALDQMFAGGDAEKDNDGSAYERARLSYFGRVAYNYKQKYMAEFLWRYDGSYMFPIGGRWGFFPGVLVGWNISEENFWKNSVPFVNFLKLRVSYGQMGNDQVYYDGELKEYQYLATYGFGSYIINDDVVKTLYETRLPNPSFTWEVANNANIGIDGELLEGKINFTFDVFYNKRANILIQKEGSTPASAGIVLPPVNLGRVDNKGYEFKVGYNDKINDFIYNISINGGYAKNEIVEYDAEPGLEDYQKAVGHSFGSNGPNFLAYKYDGVFKDQTAIDKNTIDYSSLVNELRPGDMKFKDMNHDGKITGLDKVRLDKNRDPTFSGGLNLNMQYKNFDCSIMFQGAMGGLLWIGIEGESGDIGNFLKYTYDHRWTIEHPSSKYPRIANRGDTYYSANGAASMNTYYLRSSDYLRLKNVEIGYTLPVRISEKLSIEHLRVYISGLNLITWDKMKIWDPESTSSDAHYYPQARIMNVGASVKF